MYSLGNNPWNPLCVPELHKDFGRLPSLKAIGELVGRPTREHFTNLEERAAVQSRPLEKYDERRIKELAATQPLDIRLYDILEVNGKSLLSLPLAERRATLENLLTKHKTKHILATDQRIISDPAELREATLQMFEDGHEGFVVKDLTTPYIPPGKDKPVRGKDWIKLKTAPTFDVIVLGLYQTPELLRKGWPCSNLLGGVQNTRTGKLETLTKITFPSEAKAREAYERLAPHLACTWSPERKHFWENEPTAPVQHDPSVLYNPALLGRKPLMKKIPFLYVKDPLRNSYVIEAECLNVSSGKDNWHSCGLEDGGKTYTLLQARQERIRDDKTTAQATTSQQILKYVADFLG
jgi:ATP-dependent DNA ligase